MNDIDWDILRLFARVARSGSLSGAAAQTGVSAPTIGRHMLALERALGRTLFVRRQTGYTLAPDGEVLMERVRGMEIAASAIDDWREGLHELPIVAISAGTWMSRFIADNLRHLWTPSDAFRLCFKTAEAVLDLERREADIALRYDRPDSGNLASLPTVDIAFAPFCARSFDQARDCNWVALGSEQAITRSAKWVLAQEGLWITVWANTPSMLLDLVLGGAGRCVLPCFIGDNHPGLVRAGPAIPDLRHRGWIVSHDDERRRPEVRLVIDRIAGLHRKHAELFRGDMPRTG